MLAVRVLHVASDPLPHMSTKKHPLQQGVTNPFVFDVDQNINILMLFLHSLCVIFCSHTTCQATHVVDRRVQRWYVSGIGCVRNQVIGNAMSFELAFV